MFGSCRKHLKNFAIKTFRFLAAVYGGGGSARPKSSEEKVGEQQENVKGYRRCAAGRRSGHFCGLQPSHTDVPEPHHPTQQFSSAAATSIWKAKSKKPRTIYLVQVGNSQPPYKGHQ